MNIVKNKLLNKVCAIITIFALTISDFLIIGTTTVSYAIDIIQTNHANVDFSAYFLNENGEKIESVEKTINEEDYMYIDISVKNEGYFNGKITLNNNNFNIKEEILSPEISEISGNTVTLQQLNAGNSITIKVKVEAIKDSTVNQKILNSKTDVVLEGEYVNSKKVAKDKYIAIKGTATVDMSLKSSEESKVELGSKLLTNKLYEVNGESKRIVQVLVNSKLTNNDYPVKNTEIVASVPENVEEVKVHARSTAATNSNIAFGESNYKKQGEKLTVSVSNDDKKAISWNKGVEDSYVITYVLSSDQNILNKDISVEDKITTYENKQLTASQNVHIDQEIDGIIEVSNSTVESYIYKGKLYTGEERNYTVNSILHIDALNVANNVELQEEATYMAGEAEGRANIFFRQTKIDKAEFLRLFGPQGTLEIKAGERTITIDANSDVDENGKIVVNYPTVNNIATKITMLASEPKALGALNIEHTKTIKNTEYTRDQVANLTGIKENIGASYNSKPVSNSSTTIELKETSSKASLDINTTSLSSAEVNEQVKITIVLQNNDESRDLYKDPVVKLIFPKEVVGYSAHYELLYGNGLTLNGKNKTEIDGAKCFEIYLTGTQEKYNTETLEGTTIIMYADLEVQEVAEDIETEMKLLYTNELAKSYEDMGEVRKSIKIFKTISDENTPEEKPSEVPENPTPEVVNANIVSSLKAYVGEDEIKTNDPIYVGEVVRYELIVENKGAKAAQNVNVEAIIPENTTAVTYVKCSDNNGSEEGGMTGSFDYFKTVETTDGKLLGQIETLKAGEKKTIPYEVKINSEAANTTISSYAQIKYDESEESITTDRIENSVSNAEIEMTMIMKGRGKNTLYSNSVYGYNLTVKNISGRKLSNVEIKINTNSCKLENVFKINEKNSEEIDFENNKFTIDLGKDETATYGMNIAINNKVEMSSISAVANNLYRSNKVIETVKNVQIDISMNSENEGETIKNGDNVIYNIQIKNNGSADINDLFISQEISNYLNVEKVTVNNQEVEFSKNDSSEEDDDKDTYKIGFNYTETLQPGQNLTMVVETSSNSKYLHSKDIQLSSIASVTALGELSLSEEVNHILEANLKTEDNDPGEDDQSQEDQSEQDPNEQDPSENKPGENKPGENKPGENKPGENKPGENKPGENTPAEKKYVISGTAWLDDDRDGKRSSGEETLKGIKVTLLNLEDNSTIEATTSEKGFYMLPDVKNGKYVAIFEFDTEKYVLTKYKASGVSDSRNSDVENVTMKINGESKTVSSTDVIEVKGKNIANIDIGLAYAKTFDLALSKTISKVVITNQAGTNTTEYKDSQLAKAEIKAKYLKGTTVLVEYKIKVKNEGEVAGYAKNIVDYKPSDLSFNSSLNTDWYQSGENLYTTSLSGTKIEPGEAKELTLVLTKTMTESNTGLVNNMAEIQEDYNSLKIGDIDSVAGNKNKSEDDMGSANLIISVSTGAAVSYVALTMSVIIALGVGAYLTSKKILKENIKF